MKYISKLFLLVVLVGVFLSCEKDSDIEQQKEKLTKYKEEMIELRAKIAELEKDLIEKGAIKKNVNIALVSTLKVKPKKFEHKVDIRGSVKSRNNILIAPEVPGNIIRVLVSEGQRVSKGQLLVELDGDVLRRSIKELQSSLDLATTIYERQKKLWDNNIGTEVQYLESKNRKESLELKLATSKSELKKTQVRAPFSGTVDLLDARIGEMAQVGMPIVRLVSMSNMYIKADVSESFVGKFKAGQPVTVYFPSTDYRLSSTISSIGQVIDPNNRTFELEVRIPSLNIIKPNMLAVLTISDYENERALVVPTNLIQTDKNGEFLYHVVKKDSLDIASRVDVEVGISFKNETEVVRGLTGGETIVDKGATELTDGSQVKIAEVNSI